MHSASAHVMAAPAAIDGAVGRKRRVLIFVTEPRNPTEITGLAAGSGLKCLTAVFGDAGMGYVGDLTGGCAGDRALGPCRLGRRRSRLPEDAVTSAQGSGQRGHHPEKRGHRPESSREAGWGSDHEDRGETHARSASHSSKSMGQVEATRSVRPTGGPESTLHRVRELYTKLRQAGTNGAANILQVV